MNDTANMENNDPIRKLTRSYLRSILNASDENDKSNQFSLTPINAQSTTKSKTKYPVEGESTSNGQGFQLSVNVNGL